MAYVERELGLLVKLDPSKARARISGALATHKTQQKAATALGVSRSSLLRWIKALKVSA